MNQTVQDTTEAAKDKAREATSQASDQARTQVDDKSTQAGEQLQDRADSLHAVGDEMRERGDDTFAQVADRVAGWTEDAARYLRDADADRMLGDVEAYARRQPWAVAAGGALLGFAASRVVRAGTDRRRQTSGELGYGTSYEPLDVERDTDLRTAATDAGYAAGAGSVAGDDFGHRASIAPEPGQDAPPAVPDVSPVPETDPSPLGDPVPSSDPDSTGFYRPADVDR